MINKKILSILIICILLTMAFYNNLNDSNIYAFPNIDEYNYGFIERNTSSISYSGNYYLSNSKKPVLTSDGGYFTISNISNTQVDGMPLNLINYFILNKYNANGSLEWSKRIGGTLLPTTTDGAIFKGLKETNDGYVLMYGVEDSKNKLHDSFLVKYNKQGEQQWSNSFDGNKYDSFENFFEVDDGYICFGNTMSTNILNYPNKGGFDHIIVKFNKEGQQQFAKTWGGNGFDLINKVIKTNDGYIVFGITESTNISGLTIKGTRDIVMCKYDNNLELQSVKQFGGNGSDTMEDVIMTSDNGYVISGFSQSTDIEGIINKGDFDAFVLKLNINLEKEWIKSFGGDGSDEFYSIQETSDNGFLLSGETYSKTFEGIETDWYSDIFVKIDSNGETDFIKTNLDNYYLYQIVGVDDYYIGVGGEVSDSEEYEHPFIIVFDNKGNEFYKEKLTGNNEDYYDRIIPINKSNYLLMGRGKSTDLPNINNTLGNTMFFKLISEQQTVKRKQVSQSIDLQVVADNSLELSISTNKISFEGYNGVEDLTNDNLNLTVSSGLYYDLYATLDSEIRGTNDTNAIIDKANLKIKTSDDLDYKSFANIGEKVNLVANHKNGRDFVHNINLKLLKDSSVKADTYNTNITFEVIQK